MNPVPKTKHNPNIERKLVREASHANVETKNTKDFADKIWDQPGWVCQKGLFGRPCLVGWISRFSISSLVNCINIGWLLNV